MTRLVLSSLVAAVVAMSALGCNGGFDNNEANITCSEEETSYPQCWDDGTTANCVSCHEECGDACATVETVCPVQFTCPTDD